jgi:hypothetical protein
MSDISRRLEVLEKQIGRSCPVCHGREVVRVFVEDDDEPGLMTLSGTDETCGYCGSPGRIDVYVVNEDPEQGGSSGALPKRIERWNHSLG